MPFPTFGFLWLPPDTPVLSGDALERRRPAYCSSSKAFDCSTRDAFRSSGRINGAAIEGEDSRCCPIPTHPRVERRVGASACYGRPITRAPRGRSDARDVRRAIDVHVPTHLFRTPCSGSLQHPGVDQPLAEVPTASSIVRSASSSEFVPSSRGAPKRGVRAATRHDGVAGYGTALRSPPPPDIHETRTEAGSSSTLDRLRPSDLAVKARALPLRVVAKSLEGDGIRHPKVNANASTPASRNSISNSRSTMGPGWRIR